MTGRIRKIDLQKRFGFIETSDKKDYFFHSEDCPEGNFDELYMRHQRDDIITLQFMPDKTVKGLRARNVILLGN